MMLIYTNPFIPVCVAKKLLSDTIRREDYNKEAADSMAQAHIDNYFKESQHQQFAIDDARCMFEEVYLGNNKQAATKNTTTGDYVLPSVEDAWSGWKALWLLKFKHMYSEV